MTIVSFLQIQPFSKMTKRNLRAKVVLNYSAHICDPLFGLKFMIQSDS